MPCNESSQFCFGPSFFDVDRDGVGNGVTDDDAAMAVLSSNSLTLMLLRLLCTRVFEVSVDLSYVTGSGDGARLGRGAGSGEGARMDFSTKTMDLSSMSSSSPSGSALVGEAPMIGGSGLERSGEPIRVGDSSLALIGVCWMPGGKGGTGGEFANGFVKKTDDGVVGGVASVFWNEIQQLVILR